jgi:hypothetical protein
MKGTTNNLPTNSCSCLRLKSIKAKRCNQCAFEHRKKASALRHQRYKAERGGEWRVKKEIVAAFARVGAFQQT